jgi:hypothetical protein
VSGNHYPYHEELLHWIWETQHFDFRELKTGQGQKVTINATGTPNKSDGPDFVGAEITIDNLKWYGDVEIHWTLSDWKAHGHHSDPNYEQVILHVIFEESDQKIYRNDHTDISTLSLSPYLDKPLQSFLEQYMRKQEIPCSGQLSFISEKAFEQQLQKAHKEYFEQKVDDLLEFYDPSLVPSSAWLKMFAIALFDGLGISHNRLPMRKLAIELFPKTNQLSSVRELRNKAVQISGLKSGTKKIPFGWNHKGVRPGNHPLPRIKQGAEALWHIKAVPFDHWRQKSPKVLWNNMTNSISTTPSLGRQRADILFGTVFLPALYSLGNLLFCKQLKSNSWRLWKDYRVSLPESLLQLLEQTDLSPSTYAQKLGTIYQLRSYCRPRKCQDCKVFKSAISS